jgi:hypothetical protein
VYVSQDGTVQFADDLNDLAAYLARQPRRWTLESSRSNPPSRDWDLNIGYQGAEVMAREGWHKGARKLTLELDNLPAPNAARTEARYDVGGHFPDVPRYLAGDPAHMVRRGKRHDPSPVVHVVLSGTASYNVTAGELMNFGLAIASIIDQLEAGGRRVELDIVFASENNGTKTIRGWKVKRADDPLDASAIAYSLGHPGAFRRLGFALTERMPQALQSSNYGYPRKMARSELSHINANEDALLIHGVGSAAGACATVKGALAYAKAQVNEAAGEELC